MEPLLTPKQVARAIGVSESSLKRWCDQGELPSIRTSGGHRRLPLAGVIEYLRKTQLPLVNPEVLGLPRTVGKGPRVIDRAEENLRAALVSGDDETCRQVVFDLYLAKQRVAVICDLVIAAAFHRIGELWDCGDIEVYQERRGCEICFRVLHELLLMLPPPSASAPLAIGGTPEGDPYRVPMLMVELTLREAGWRAVTLGSSLPFSTLAAAIGQSRPRLFFLSVSHIPDTEGFVAGYADLYRAATSQGTSVVVGGQALSESLRGRLQFSAFCEDVRRLDDFVAALDRPAVPAGGGAP